MATQWFHGHIPMWACWHRSDVPADAAGFGFAIPSDTVRRVVNQLIKYGRVVRPGLGVYLLHDIHAKKLLGGTAGVVVQHVAAKSGAHMAGLQGVELDGFGNVYLGDVIVSVGGSKVGSVEDLVAYVETFSVGDQVPLVVHRYGGKAGAGKGFEVLQLAVPLLTEVKNL
jgi:S1-C subfamily serine protease